MPLKGPAADEEGILHSRAVGEGHRGAKPFGPQTKFHLHYRAPFRAYAGPNNPPLDNWQAQLETPVLIRQLKDHLVIPCRKIPRIQGGL